MVTLLQVLFSAILSVETEYLQNGRATEKSDIYRFGVLLLELVTRKRPTNTTFVKRGLNVAGWMNTLPTEEDRLDDVTDKRCVDVDKDSIGGFVEISCEVFAKLLVDEETHVTTYLAPGSNGRVTEKYDVYIFGVLLLELVTGKRPTDTTFVKRGLNVAGCMNTLPTEEDRLDDVTDKRCVEVDEDSIREFVEISCEV
ncbi:protein NSP-INTERACTING KINASE 1-like [Raphanus sativus]|uniref:Protein NSP-INTERACTING KINASE 1-like n=1 Tax=Raphanus sativus TaxID=3726 RepID=A0A6J0L1N3_RAPSA|nr:protein NSP-INTERACTING KINASE 1-like [Raphanus sativus]